MPTDDVVGAMYSADYTRGFESRETIDDPRSRTRVIDLLQRLSAGRFIDYGCGGGELLDGASRAGWQVAGVELDAAVAAMTAARYGVDVLTPGIAAQKLEGWADVIHFGDVLEHLTDPSATFRSALTLLKPGGWVVAQGPLEANANLFTLVMRLWKLGSRKPAESAPYHVLIATAAGQRAFFARHDLHEDCFTLSEVDWPAPSSWAGALTARGRTLYALRAVSKQMTRLHPHQWGNRFFYVGRSNRALSRIGA